jgi:lysyl-tRNA synthetase class 1
MQWLNKIVDELIARHPNGEIVVSSGVSPSGTYHLGTLREVLTAEIIAVELRRRGRDARHLHICDDLDIFRKVPVDVDPSFEKYLGMPLCDVPSPDGKADSYADYFVQALIDAAKEMKLSMELVRAHEKYRNGYFVPAIETALDNIGEIRRVLEEVSGRQLDQQWSPIQVIENGRLKNRQFKSIDISSKTLVYVSADGEEVQIGYASGDVKLNWRIDWPARWALMNVQAEPFGRDHASKGGSYDTGVEIVRKVFKAEPPYPVPYDFINKTGETKKMSKSKGDVITAAQLLELMPVEILWFFILRSAPSKMLYFDEQESLMKLFDEFAELLNKPDKTEAQQQLIDLCLHGVDAPTASNIPFTHLVASYQASLKDKEKTIEVIARTEHKETAEKEKETLIRELKFIDNWLNKSAPEEVKFELQESVDESKFSEEQKAYLAALSEKISNAPEDADGMWFHQAIYEFKDHTNLQPKELFTTLYQALIAKDSGPRAGWFLSLLPRDWLIRRLKLEV